MMAICRGTAPVCDAAVEACAVGRLSFNSQTSSSCTMTLLALERNSERALTLGPHRENTQLRVRQLTQTLNVRLRLLGQILVARDVMRG